jgi:Reverse transcriptase (RNA-dependent DNA polymerase)
LSFVSKILERLINIRLTEFMNKYSLLPKTQSAYREHHSTETALVRIHNDIVTAIDHGDVCALVLLDLSAAFDTVDHSILLDVLQTRFGVVDNSLTWIDSYLSDRTQQVCIGQDRSKIFPMPYGVPQGSVLGPKQFIAYTEDIVGIFDRLDVTHHGYADDTQGLVRSSPSDIKKIVSTLEEMVNDVGSWCASRRLQLNASKTDLIWFGMPSSLSKLDPNDMKLSVGNATIIPNEVVRDLGFYFDSKLSMQQHISRVTKICFFQLRRLRPIRRQLGRHVAQRLVSAFVLSRLDYCNALLAELPASTLAPLQRCQNAAARLVLNLKTSDHITPALIELHWLPVKQRIIYKICLLVYKSLSDLAPSYLRELLIPLSAIPSRSSLRSSSSSDLSVPATRLRFGDRAFAVSGARQWNRLPGDLRTIPDVTNFKKQLKTYLFREAYDLS